MELFLFVGLGEMRACALILVVLAVRFQLPPDVARHQLDGEQVFDPAQPPVVLEIPQVGDLDELRLRARRL
jgi:hypothetical protein